MGSERPAQRVLSTKAAESPFWTGTLQAARNSRRIFRGIVGTFLADVSDPAKVQHAISNVVVGLGGLDVVINNAGISIRHNFLDITAEEWNQVLAVNLSGVFYVAWPQRDT